jgi:hypothetical protein
MNNRELSEMPVTIRFLLTWLSQEQCPKPILP